MTYILSALVVLGLLIFVHELGHFLLAKLFGVGVEKFSLGFGPKIIGKTIGETEYLLSAFPLGGYVKMIGESPDVELPPEDVHRSFMAKPPLQRIAIVAAGPVFNLLFALLLFIVIYMLGVPAATTRVGEVLDGKPAAAAGIKPQDLVMSVNGRSVTRWDEFSALIADSKGLPLDITVKRGESLHSFRIVPETREGKNLFGEKVIYPAIGVVAAAEMVTDRFSPPMAVVKGTQQCWKVIKLTLLSIVKLIERVVPLDTVGGPIMIAKMAGEQAAAGGVNLIAFMALLSINLGILNLLPVPILDGGHLLFFTMELIFRRPVTARAREIAQQIGLAMLLSLMVLAFYNDIVRYVINRG
ncbi:MAG: RIP metalloprotease RseP [Geobacter sp.]|nr:RIP metalloprotease RseP [Geobacter sp.]